MLFMAALGFISAVMLSLAPGSTLGLFTGGNMAGIGNGLILGLLNALLWYGLVYAVFLVTAAVLGLADFARRRAA